MKILTFIITLGIAVFVNPMFIDEDEETIEPFYDGLPEENILPIPLPPDSFGTFPHDELKPMTTDVLEFKQATTTLSLNYCREKSSI